MRLSIIIPTYNEGENLKPLLEGLNKALSDVPYDLDVWVADDDSPDKTYQFAEDLRGVYPFLNVLRRTENKGLSPAVLDGFRCACGDVLLVMDADLSHPPDQVPLMVDRLLRENADVVVGSRYVEGGGSKDWPFSRRLISKSATLLARGLTDVSDPMSGFFAVKKEVVEDVSRFNPRGFKILLEVLVKGDYGKLVEHPFVF
ncbi:MAG: glycosyltransferase, partial [Candidatus Altiarchaeales archaeon]|nr:glycosyltransferase [Candidatus Altiarchaeales archaeon]